MKKKKGPKLSLKRIVVEVECSKCGPQSVEVESYDFMYFDNGTNMYGHHGDLSVDVKCPECGVVETFELRSW